VKALTLVLLLLVNGGDAWAGGPWHTQPLALDSLHHDCRQITADAGGENHRAVAIGLAVVLGPFGAHRLYLGTTPLVAAVYGLTLGGFGVLVLIDLVNLIAAKDIDRFKSNDKVLMWVGGAPTPP
jgi:hypothetical protein